MNTRTIVVFALTAWMALPPVALGQDAGADEPILEGEGPLDDTGAPGPDEPERDAPEDVATTEPRDPGPGTVVEEVTVEEVTVEEVEDIEEVVGGWEGVDDVEDLSLSELLDLPVTGASRYEQRQSAAPTSTTVLTQEDIRIYGWRTLSDALRSVRSTYITNDRNYEFIGVRGFGIPSDYNTRILVLLDGHRVNDAVYDSTDPGFGFPLDLADVDRIEIIRGPASSVYGANAAFGVINIISRSGARRQAVGAEGRTGSNGYNNGYVHYGQRFDNDLDVALSFSGGTLSGEQRIYFPELDDPASANGIATNLDGEQFLRGFSSLRWGDFSFTGAFGIRDKDVPTASFGTLFDDPGTFTVDSYSVFGLGYDGDLGDQWGLSGHLTFNHYEYIGEYPYEDDTVMPPDRYINRDEAVGNWLGADLQLRKTWFDALTVAVGTEYRYLLTVDQRNFDTYSDGSDFSYLDDEDRGWVLGAYLQAQLALFDDVLTIDAGARFDAFQTESPVRDFSTVQSAINPRAAVIVRPTDTTIIRALYGSAFRAANAFERYYTFGDAADGEAQLFNPNLDPERVQTGELVVEQYLGSNVRAVLAGYVYKIDDLVVLGVVDALDNTQFNNAGGAVAFGGELELEAKFPGIVRGRLSYGLQRTENDAGETLTNSPTHLAKLNLAVPVVRDKLFMGLEVQYMSPRTTILGTEDTDHHVLTNFTIYGQEFVPGLSFTASVRNLFDQRYTDPASTDHDQNAIPQLGRTFWLGLKYDFGLGAGGAATAVE